MTAADDARFWDKIAPRYAASKIADPDGYVRTLERTSSFLKPDQHVLELGCGTGTTALRLAGAVGSYLGTDISEQMIGIARQKLGDDPVLNLSFRPAVAAQLVADDERYDVVLAFNYLHLVGDLGATLRTIHGLLRPRGLFISKTPCLEQMHPLIRRLVLPAMRMVGKAPRVGIFGDAALTQQIADAGFDILAHESHATRGTETRPFIVARQRDKA